MNNTIIEHIFQYFGIGETNNQFLFTILDNKYLIDKKLSIELEDNKCLQQNVWALTGKINTSTIKVLAADISVDEEQIEYVLLLQLDELSIYALKLQKSPNISGTAYVNSNKHWAELTNLLLAKLLVGIEQLNELFIDYKSMTNYQELYQYLIDYLQYDEALQNNQ